MPIKSGAISFLVVVVISKQFFSNAFGDVHVFVVACWRVARIAASETRVKIVPCFVMRPAREAVARSHFELGGRVDGDKHRRRFLFAASVIRALNKKKLARLFQRPFKPL